ncbi:MAG: triple tyrosine motif-containing protein, partial [Bacteroidota bacterium]
DGECTAVFKDRQGVVWFGVQGLGLVSFDTAFRYFPNELKKPGDFTGIYQIAQDASVDSILWLATGTGLTRFNKATGAYFFPDRKPPDGHEISLILTALFPTKDKIFLGSTWRHGGFIYDIATGRFRNLEVKNPQFSGVELKLGNFQPRSPNTIWGFTDEGIVVIDIHGDSLLAAFRNTSISSETRNCTALPKRLWAGAHGGLLRYDFTIYTVENHRIRQDAKRRPEILWSALEQEPGGKKLWLCFQTSDFIYDYDRARRAFKTIPKYPGTRAAPAWLLRLHDGRILATGDGGIFELRDNRLFDLHLLREIISAKEQISHPFQDRTGRLWLTSRFAGFYEIDLKTGAWRDAMAGKKSWATPFAFMDSRGNFWLSGNGFSIYNPLTDSLLRFPFRPGEHLTSHHPRGYEEDGEGNIWLSDIRVGGLMKVDAKHLEKGIVERYDAPGGGQRNLMRALKKDRRGRIWAVTEAGLQVFDSKAKTFRLFGEAAGFQLMSDIGFVSNLSSNLTLLSTGEMLVGYKNGFAIFHPDSLTENRELPKPYLLAVSANEKPLTAGVSFGSGQPLRLRYNQNILEFGFSSIAFYEPKKIRYRYRLQGFDKDWAETSHRFLRYTHLPPGNYTFRLLALNSDDYHAAQPLEWHFCILPPWWATWWAYLAYLLLAAAAAYSFYFYKKKQWQMQAALEMEHREAERLKELDTVKTSLYTNITHEFRTPLTIILG